MRQHTGAHARHGATDVCPFVPVAGMTMEDAVALAHEVGERIGNEPEPLADRYPRFFLEDFTLRADDGEPIMGRVVGFEARRRVVRPRSAVAGGAGRAVEAAAGDATSPHRPAPRHL